MKTTRPVKGRKLKRETKKNKLKPWRKNYELKEFVRIIKGMKS